ncbi:MAG TPA: DUF1990 domain-containing protein [Drouetiella sp.]
MFLTHKPTEAELSEFLVLQSRLNVGYAGYGMTSFGKNHAQAGYRKHFVQTTLGFGQRIFDAACDQMKSWRHFSLNWILLFPSQPTFAPDTTLVVCANHFVLWSMNACRIVYTVDDSTKEKRRFGYAYGTLPDHVEQGEESFIIEWNKLTNAVTYQILAYSKPNHLLVSMFWPAAVLIQDHFREQSLAAFRDQVTD